VRVGRGDVCERGNVARRFTQRRRDERDEQEAEEGGDRRARRDGPDQEAGREWAEGVASTATLNIPVVTRAIRRSGVSA
jgi:hypothetical protein